MREPHKIKISSLNIDNPLFKEDLSEHNINFQEVMPCHFIEAIDTLIPLAKEESEEHLNNELDEKLFEASYYQKHLDLVMSFLTMLNMTSKTKEIQDLYEDKMIDYITYCNEQMLDSRFYKKIKEYRESPKYHNLSDLNKKILNDCLSSLEEGGIHLPDVEKDLLKEMHVSINELTTKFDNNLIATKQEMSLTFTEDELEGLSQRALDNFERTEDGLYIGNDIFGNFTDILNNCNIENTRKKVYELSREVGIWKNYDNREIAKSVISLLHKEAKLLGFNNYAEYKMSKNMVKNSDEVLKFLNELGERALKKAKNEIKELNEYSMFLFNKVPESHDFSFVLNQLRNEKYCLDNEEQRKYFPVSTVRQGLFDLVEGLYGVKFIKDDSYSVWNDDVDVYSVYENNEKIGTLFLDLFNREIKEEGAYMSGIIGHNISNITNEKTLPVCHIVLDLPKFTNKETTLTFTDVVVLFHEMGHGLHHLLTKVRNSYFSGTNRVELDAVELPSQFMENFCLDYEVLKKISKHTESGEVLPLDEYEKIKSSRSFFSGYNLLRQIVMAEIDMRIYSEPESCPLIIEKEVREKWQVREMDLGNMVLPSFAHIISYDYNAGYYSYLWAEVLSMDAFNALKEAGDSYKEQKEMANKFRKHILETGGENPMLKNFIDFREREPNINYLLESYGI